MFTSRLTVARRVLVLWHLRLWMTPGMPPTMRITVCILAFVFISFLVATEDVGETLDRQKRVSSTAVERDEGLPNANVEFDDAKNRGSKQTFRKMMKDTGGSISNGRSYKFPIIMPPYNQEGVSPASPKPEWGSCLLYMESISVIVFAAQQQPGSVVAIVDGANGKNTFNFGDGAMSCLKKQEGKGKDKTPQEFWFRIEIDVKEAAKSTKFGEPNNVLFSVDGPIKLLLKFQRKSDFSWELTDAVADSVSVKKGSYLLKDLSVNGVTSVNANRTVKIGGFGDYSYACSSTPVIAFPVDDKYTLGVSLNNIQLQPYGLWIGDGAGGKKAVRFGRNVNDCVGLFSVGSWMGIVVAIILLMVLFFGYLMLNSVQTMDRFDDPKQKQLIINAKE